jgi:biotin carboxyl carrier protein
MSEPLASAPPTPSHEGDGVSRLSERALQGLLRERGWRAATAALCTELSLALGCRRVALGWQGEGRVRVVGLSHGAQLAEHPVLGGVAEAMQEAMTQGLTLCVPRVADGAVRITLAHRALLKHEGAAGVLTVPLAQGGEVLGALLCERDDGRFTPVELMAMEEVAGAVAPLLRLLHDNELSWRQRWQRGWREWLHTDDPRTRRLRQLGLGVGVLALLALMAVPLPHRVQAAARVEGAEQRGLTAPIDAYLRQLHVRPGDFVKKGQVLAQLSDEDLRQQARSREAEIAQHDNAFVDAFTKGERSQAAQAQARATEARAQLALVAQQLARTRITAPFDGVVISGDLSQRLGAPFKRSDLLFTVSPMTGWRVVLEVDERQITRVQSGQVAKLLLTALPSQPVELTVQRITPVAKTVEGRQRYEVVANPVGAPPAGWRPGLQGVARIELAPEPLGWRWGREAWQAWRWASWSWL